MSLYVVDYDEASTHIPAHPERTAMGNTNPFSVYYREFPSRPAMEQWLKRQSWELRQQWRSWMSVERNRRLLRQHTSLVEYRAAAQDLQPSLFA